MVTEMLEAGNILWPMPLKKRLKDGDGQCREQLGRRRIKELKG